MDFIDTHCHLDSILAKLEMPDFRAFKAKYLESDAAPEPAGQKPVAGQRPVAEPRCVAAFGGCISISCDPDSIAAVSALMREEGVHGAFGIHPHDAKSYGPELEARLLRAMADPKAVAWGEIGLD